MLTTAASGERTAASGKRSSQDRALGSASTLRGKSARPMPLTCRSWVSTLPPFFGSDSSLTDSSSRSSSTNWT